MNASVVFDNPPKWIDVIRLQHWLIHEMKGLDLSLEVVYVFMSDEELLKLNVQHLDHDTYTDIITYDFRSEGLDEANLCISVDRVLANSETFNVTAEDELLRVCVHGLLHLAGFGDKTENEALEMRRKEQLAIDKFHVEQ
ncbi:MAG: rRNA maturation RNase YbeY [Bacteroidetes bacterium]|nr:rRNA maturation RNase YbeY [Bacteroidota bacterium]MDA0843917.1 rRNA maturation RNase YbeY [Bacteroidota bacterium]